MTQLWKRRESHPSSVEEAGRGVGVEETGLSHPGGVCSGAEGSGPERWRGQRVNPSDHGGAGAGVRMHATIRTSGR